MILPLLWTLIVTTLHPVAPPTVDFRSLAAKDMQASVLLHMNGVKAGKKASFGCSGTYVSPNEILTAAHCFEDYEVKKIYARGTNDPLGYRVLLAKIDHENDLALLRAPFRHPYARIGAAPHVGDEVMAIGSPLFFEFAVSEGVVSVINFSTHGIGGVFTVHTAAINHGSSGGGLFNKKGQLIGVNTRSVGLFGWEGISMAIDSDVIRRFLNG